MSARPTTAGWLRQRGGRASFAEFMAAALYDSETGYYSRTISGVGRRGDFSTSATLHPILAEAVAGWLQRQWEARGFLPVIEVGAGDGSLASGIFSALSWWKRRKINYHIVDVSAPLMARQKEKLKKRKVCWHGDIRSALQAAQGRALIFSNELADAFPCRLLQKSAGGWEEIFLRLRGEGIEEEREELHPEIWSGWSACAANLPWKAGQRVEVQDSFRQWLSSWVPDWKQGSMLTVDYGAEREKLYWRRPEGTLRAYFSHLRLEGADVYARMGQQDLTADVNFTDLRNWGEALGLKTAGLSSQREFIQKHAGALLRKRPSPAEMAFLQDPQGAGEAFRVLVQER